MPQPNSPQPSQLDTKTETQLVKLSLEELRHLFNRITRIYDNLKSRTLAIVAGEVAVVSFIFSGKGITIDKDTDLAVKIFYLVGILMVGIAFLILLWIISTSNWKLPYDTTESRKLKAWYDSEIKLLTTIKEDYETCIDFCLSKIASRGKIFNITLIILSAGVIILMVLKFSTQGGAT